MNIEAFFDPHTYSLTYVVYDTASRDAIIIDPVLDYDPGAARIATTAVDKVLEFIRTLELKPHFVLETHAHADHLSAAQHLKQAFPQLQVAIGERVTAVQAGFKKVFDLSDDFATDGSQFDRLLRDKEEVSGGSLAFTVVATPGHTPSCCSFLFGDALFVGDTLFMPDYGTGRCDFPQGSAVDLYKSVIERIYTLAGETRVFVGHDYLPGGRELQFESTVANQRAENVQLNAEVSEEHFVKLRQERDAGLSAPKLLFPSVQVNINAGHLPAASANAVRYLRIPLHLPAPAEAEPDHG